MKLQINRDRFRSPNYSSRHGVSVDTLIIHHTGGKFPGCAEWLCNPTAKASAHYIVTQKGEVFQLVDEDLKAWHAGRGAFDLNQDGSISPEERRFNARSIGIELESDGKSYTETQLDILKALTLNIILRHNIPTKNILGHKEIAPGRKWDPGNFDMNSFREEIQTSLNTGVDIIA